MRKYILYWGNSNGCTWSYDCYQPFETDDIDSWQYFLELMIENKPKEDHEITYKHLTLPVSSSEFSYEIMTLEKWWEMYKNTQI